MTQLKRQTKIFGCLPGTWQCSEQGYLDQRARIALPLVSGVLPEKAQQGTGAAEITAAMSVHA